MKKGMRNFFSTLGALALLAGIGVGVYYGNDTVHKWTDEQIEKWKAGNAGDTSSSSVDDSIDDSSSHTEDSSETAVSNDGKLGVYLPNGHAFYAAAKINDTKTCVATLAPANVTAKTISWTTSDSSKIGLGSTTTLSGANQSLILVSYFTGAVKITATSVADTTIAVSFSVTAGNALLSFTFAGIADAQQLENDASRITAPKAGYVESDMTAANYYAAYDSSSNLVAYCPNANLAICFTITSSWGTFEGLTLPTWATGHTFTSSSVLYVYDIFTGTTDANGIKLTLGDYSVTVATAAYVAPTSISGSGDVSF